MIRRSFFAVVLFTLTAASHAQGQLPEGISKLELTVDGVARSGLVYAPANAKEKAAPVVFVFHGHGGNAMQIGRSIPMYQLWPEAISVYLQGLNTPGQLTDPHKGRSPAGSMGRGRKVTVI